MERENGHPPALKPSVDAELRLRQRAEARLLDKIGGSIDQTEQPSLQTTQQLLHELQLHQIELEMENEELRRTHALLDASRERYFSFYDMAPVGYCSVTEKGLISQVNLTIATLLGMPRRELIKQPFSRFIVKEDQNIFYKLRHQLLGGQFESRSCELQLTRPDGVSFWAHLAATLAHDEAGLVELRLVVKDINDRKQVEQALQQGEAFKDGVLNSVAAEIAVIDSHGVIQAVNERWRQFSLTHGATPGQPAANTGVGSNYLSVCASSGLGDPAALDACAGISAVLHGRLPSFTLEYPCHSPQQQRWFNMIVKPLRHKGQDGATITHTEITSVKQVQENLRESYAAVQSILETTLDGFWHTDLQGRLLDVNPSYCQISGYTRDELLGLRISDLEAIESPGDTAERMERLIRTGRDQFETRHRRKDGSLWRVEVSTTFNAHLSTPSCFVFSRDITERKRLQQSILDIERQRFEQLDKLTASVPGVVYQFRVEPDGTCAFLYLSAAIDSLFELKPQDAYLDPNAMTHCIVQEDRASHQASVEHSFKTLTPWVHEHRIQTRSGGLKWVRGQALPEPQADGSVIWYGILTDITAVKQADEQMRQSEFYLRSIFDAALDAVIGMDDQGRIIHWNKRAEAIFGWRKDEAVGRMLHETITPDQHRMAQQRGVANFLATGNGNMLNRRIEIKALRRNGEEFPVELSILPFNAITGYQFTAFVSDISARKRIEAKLVESEKKFRLIAENTSDGITIFDKDKKVIYVSPSVTRQLGYSELEELGRSSTDVYAMLDPDGRDALFQEINAAIQNKAPALTYSYRIKHKSGHYIWREDSTNFSYSQSGEYDGAYVVSRDITERKRVEAEVRQLAHFDPLTQLPNRRMLNDRLSQAVAASKRSGRYGALMILDLDNFKPLNDQHGHLMGDLLLIEAARRLGDCVREVDTVARFGGDEFVVILSDLDADKAESRRLAQVIAEKVRTALAAPYVLAVHQENQAPATVQQQCSASIGVVLFLNHHTAEKDILNWADASMYQAKKAGRNAIRFHEADGEK